MAISKTIAVLSSPVRDMEILEIPPLVKAGTLGKYQFLYDYQTTIYNTDANNIIANTPIGQSYTLPVGSYYNLKYSKGDVVNVIGFKTSLDSTGATITDNKQLIINVPKYVKPIGGATGFLPTITIDNSTLGWLQKEPDTTPETVKLGVGFGNNTNPASLPDIVSPTTSNTQVVSTSNTPVVVNGIEDTTASTGFFSDTNNLIMLAVGIAVTFLLLVGKNE